MTEPIKLDENRDYEMTEDSTVCITVRGKVNVYITDDEEGLWLKAYPTNDSSGLPVADTFVSYGDPALKTSDDIDGERDNEAAVAYTE